MPAEPSCDRAQHLVACEMPDTVVDDLEVINVDEHHCHAAIGATGVSQGTPYAFTEKRAIGQPREFIMMCQVLQLLLDLGQKGQRVLEVALSDGDADLAGQGAEQVEVGGVKSMGVERVRHDDEPSRSVSQFERRDDCAPDRQLSVTEVGSKPARGANEVRPLPSPGLVAESAPPIEILRFHDTITDAGTGDQAEDVRLCSNCDHDLAELSLEQLLSLMGGYRKRGVDLRCFKQLPGEVVQGFPAGSLLSGGSV